MSDTKALMTSEHENELRADIESGKRLQPIPIGSVLPLLNTIESLRAENARLKDKADTYDFVCKELGTKDHILEVVAVMREKLKAAQKIATLAVKHRRRWPNEWAEEHQRDIDTYTNPRQSTDARPVAPEKGGDNDLQSLSQTNR